MNFTLPEKQVIRDAIALRQQEVSDCSEHLSKTDLILKAIDAPILKLSSSQKSLLRGCIKGLVIDPNISLLGLSDFEVFQAKEEMQTIFDFFDTGLRILNKLKDDDYGNCRLFQTVSEKTKTFSGIKTVFYSLSGDKIYKAGVVTKGKMGLRIDIGHSDYSKFDIVKLYRDQFMYEGSPADIISRVKAYEQHNTPQENHKRLLAILEPAIAN